MKRWASTLGVLTGLGCVAIAALVHAEATAPTAPEQTVMGPGLYMFQTRVDNATCNDTERDGYVNSFYGMIDGVPGGKTMTLRLLGTSFWPTWQLEVSADGEVLGDAKVDDPNPSDRSSHFAVKRDGKRFKGKGVRSYNAVVAGKPTRCSISYDALLLRIDS